MKIRRLTDKHDKQDLEHEELGIPPLEEQVHEEPSNLLKYSLIWGGVIVGVLALVFILTKYLAADAVSQHAGIVLSVIQGKEFWTYTLVGFLAQMIDGSLGMAYGISSTTFLLTAGVSPAAASASVHMSEVFTSGVSGLTHLKFGNVNKKLFKILLIPGTIGAVLGAYIITNLDGNLIKPYISAYLLVMGIVVIRKAFKKTKKKAKTKGVGILALFGGFVDAVGGGGWGPVVTTTLIGSGRDPRYTIGSVNLAEFFIAFSGAFTFTVLMGFQNWVIIAGLIFGGVFAAPFAAYLCRNFKAKTLMVIVGLLIIFLSARTLLLVFLK